MLIMLSIKLPMFTLLILNVYIYIAFGASILELNNDNFDGIALDKSKAVLVEFYAPPPWCMHCEKFTPTYEKVATTFKNEKNCLVAKVNLEVERDFKSRYPVSEFQTTLIFFPKGSEDGAAYKYAGGKSEQELVDFLNKKCGTDVLSRTGRFGAFDELTEKFMADTDSRETSIADIEKATERTPEEKQSGEYYVKVMKKVLEKSDSYVEVEISRLNKLLSGKMIAEKRDQSFKRRNILNVFKNAISKDEL